MPSGTVTPAGGGGSSPLLLHTKVALNNAQLLTLNTIPVELVAAVPGSQILPSFITSQFSGTNYTEGGALRYYVGSSYDTSDWTKFVSHYAFNGVINPIDFALEIANNGWSTEAAVGDHLAVTAAGALTGGPGTLTIDVWYLLVVVAT